MNKLLTCGLMALAMLPGAVAQAQYPQYRQPYTRTRMERPEASVVDQTINHLRGISARNTFSRHERERYDNAMSHLSQFAQKLYNGRFDRGKLDRGIGDVENVLAHNPMDGRARAFLNNDLNELRRMRAQSYR